MNSLPAATNSTEHAYQTPAGFHQPLLRAVARMELELTLLTPRN
jgi:hypothetical protein